jgi:hypothetical protein
LRGVPVPPPKSRTVGCIRLRAVKPQLSTTCGHGDLSDDCGDGRRDARRRVALLLEQRDPAAADRRPAGQDASARRADYAFGLKRRFQAAVDWAAGSNDPSRAFETVRWVSKRAGGRRRHWSSGTRNMSVREWVISAREARAWMACAARQKGGRTGRKRKRREWSVESVVASRDRR